MHDVKIGLDLGNVLTERKPDRRGAFVDAEYRQVQPAKSAFGAAYRISALLGPDNVYVVSRCSEVAEARARDWLRHHRFFDETGVPEVNTYFCRERAQKAKIVEMLQLTHFVDDRWTVLEHLAGLQTVERLYLLRPEPEEYRQFVAVRDPRVAVVGSLAEVLQDLTP